ncbi:hypothetical protein ABDK75_02765 [Gluconobacter sp. OJA]|uniref:hypothetical protein n=1 Tax=Gluconobacter sp. OJA TaxID=3145197 RepID=UPI0031F749E8
MHQQWLIIAEDGRHVSLGRHTSPTEDELNVVEKGLLSQGLGGWLVRTMGNYYDRKKSYNIFVEKQIAPASVTWEVAETRFSKIRLSKDT